MEKKVTEEEIKEVVKEYIKRMFELFKTYKGVSTDNLIDCPQCGRSRSIEYGCKGWICLWRDCCYTFPEELMPPTAQELEAFFDRKRLEERNPLAPQEFEAFFNMKILEERINKFLNS